MADILSLVSNISYILAIVFLLLSIIFWIIFKIPSVIGDLSGRNARKSIEKLLINNEKIDTKKCLSNGEKSEKTMYGNTNSRKNGILAKGTDTLFLQEVSATIPLQEGNVTQALDGYRIKILNIYDEKQKDMCGHKIELIEEIMIIHTDEVIA